MCYVKRKRGELMSENNCQRQLHTGGNAFKFKFYLNSMHAVLFNDKSSPIHKHTWEVSLNLREKMAEFNEFNKIERVINDYLSTYNEKVINDLHPFDKLNPTMENMGSVFFEDINELIRDSNYRLESVEISENPTRTYIVDKIMHYKSMASDEHYKKMVPLLNEMRGVKNGEIDIPFNEPILNPELEKVLQNISKRFSDLDKRQEAERKRKKKRFRILSSIFIFFVLIICILIYLIFN